MRTLFTMLFLLLTHALSAQTGSVILRDAAGNMVSIHSSIQQAYDAIPSPLTQAYTVGIDSLYLGRSPYEHFPVILTAKAGTSAAHTITIRADNRDYWLTRFLVRTDSAALFVFDGASWIIVDGERATPDIEFPNGLALRGVPTSTAPRATYPLIRFVNGASHNTIRYCEINNGRRQPGRGDAAAVLFDTSAAGTGNNDNLVEHCLFDCENGLHSRGSIQRPNTHNTIRDNTFDQAYVNALTVEEGTGALRFHNNQINAGYFFTSSGLSSGVRLVKVTGFSDTLQITGNTFSLIRPSDGSSPDSPLNAVFIAPAAPTPAGSVCIVANNYMTARTGYALTHNTVSGPYWPDATRGRLTAIELRMGGVPANMLIAHNTVRLGGNAGMTNTDKLYSAAFRKEGTSPGGGIQVVNNIFDNFRQGGGAGSRHLALDLPDTSGMVLDYNLYHAADTLVAVGGNAYQTISAYRAANAGQDVHSSDSAVLFESATSYFLSASMAGRTYMAGVPIPEITIDKNGYRRVVPYRGADELVATCDTSLNRPGVIGYTSEACAGKKVYLQYAEQSWFSPVLPAGGLLHQWQSWTGGAGGFRDIPGAYTTDLVVTQNVTTSYRVKDSCVSSGQITYSNQITIPMKAATVVLDSITAAVTGIQQIIRFEVHTTGTATNYTWEFGDGRTDFSSVSTIDHYYLTPGIYTVTVYTDDECSDPVSKTIDTRVPQAVSATLPKGDLLIYPNPAAEQLQIKSAVALGRLTVTDLAGRLIFTQAAPGNAAVIQVGNLPAGIYLLRSGNGEVSRFLVQH